MDNLALARTEILQVADAVARDKGIERDEVLEAMEQAIGRAGRAGNVTLPPSEALRPDRSSARVRPPAPRRIQMALVICSP